MLWLSDWTIPFKATEMEVGDLTVWVEQGPLAILAAVIRGTAPQDLRPVFQETLENIHLQFRGALVDFDGDATRFDAARPMLEDCLHTQFDEAKRGATPKRIPVPVMVIAGLIALALLVWGFLAIRDRRRWNDYVERVRNEPGVVVTDTGSRDGKYFIGGLRDPLARDPRELLQQASVDPERVSTRFEPFQAMSPEFVIARARTLLEPPATVNLRFENGVLKAEGFAARQWITETRRVVRFVPGVTQFKDDNLLDVDRIVNPSLLFELDSTELAAGQEEQFRQLLADIERLQAMAEAMKKNVRLEITGHADGSGTEERNLELSRGRAEAIAAELNKRLPSKANLMIVPVASKEKLRDEVTEADRAANRSVTFKIILSDAQ